MPWKPEPTWKHPDPLKIETEFDTSQPIAGNRVLAKVKGQERWIVQCLKCSKIRVRHTKTLRRGRGKCVCRQVGRTAEKIGPNGETAAQLQRTRREWKRIRKLFGIHVCRRWHRGLKYFVSDLGSRPPNTWLCRKNTAGEFCKRNCYWGPRSEAEFADTIYLNHEGRRIAARQIPELKDAKRVDLLRWMKRMPRFKQGEYVLRRYRHELMREAEKKRRLQRASERSA